MSSMGSGINTSRAAAGRSRNSVKPPAQSSPVFEGVYSNARMLHFLTAVVGSACDIRVKNGSIYAGIFKTLSSKCELAVDAVHRQSEGGGNDSGGSSPAPPKREEISDTMIFSPSDLVTMTCRDVDLSYATRDSFTDTAIGSMRVNGEHKEKVLQKWDAGDSNGESYDLETDTSNGWDAGEMFKFNEENYGIKSTYDSSLAMYTMPLERDGSKGFREREARATRLASEIEASPHSCHRLAVESQDRQTEEEMYSAVVREAGERDSPSCNSVRSREGKYIPLPQQAREMGVSREGEGVGRSPLAPPPPRMAGPHSARPAPPSSSSQSIPAPSSERCSPLFGRGIYSPHPALRSRRPAPAPPRPATGPPTPPPAPPDATTRSGSGVSCRSSPKSQQPPQTSRPPRPCSNDGAPAVSHSPKPGPPIQNPPVATLDSDPGSVAMVTPGTSGPAPFFPVDVTDILNSAKERTAESPASLQDDQSISKASSVQQRSQIEALRKFGQEFRLQSSGSAFRSPGASTAPPTENAPPSPATSIAADPASALAPEASQNRPPSPPQAPPPEEQGREEEGAGSAVSSTALPAGELATADRQTPGTPLPTSTQGGEEPRLETTERAEGVANQVKKSTLNPNAKEFNPNKAALMLTKSTPAPTPPRRTPPVPTAALQPPSGHGAIYSAPYLSYISQIQIQGHSLQAPQMYQYTMSTVSQGKYSRPKGSAVSPRSDHSPTAPPMLQTAASAAGPPLVASPYPQSYLQYNPQQYSQQVFQAISHYPGQPLFSMLQTGARVLGSRGFTQTLGPSGSQYSAQGEGAPGPQQGMYGPQSFTHQAGSMHRPQPCSTPTGSQTTPQHPAPNSGQSGQSQPQSLYHSAPTPPSLPPGHASPQGSYPLQGYGLHGHQPIPHAYPSLGQMTQAHASGALAGPHHSGPHAPHQVMLLHALPPQQGPGSASQHRTPPQQGTQQHYAYIGHPQAVQVQAHPPQQLPFHPSTGN